ncbi:Golgi-associated plant pathogenesis-related protein 1-like [Ornithodoros turicata]|uniref:Golgi-associated plant pathogenesis-related protein 1-like n=1 Tax=Ornithodoros turicata TaxID=34597 RepID=UPI003138A326
MGQCCGKAPKDDAQGTMPGNVNGETKTVSTVTDSSGKVTTTTTTRRMVSSTGQLSEFKDVQLDDKGGVTTVRKIVKRTIVRQPDGSEKVIEEVTVEGDPKLLPDSGSNKGRTSSTSLLRTTLGSQGGMTKAPTPQPPQIIGGQVKATDKQFREECLKRHNFHRANHGVPPLKHSDQLTKVAQDWADTLAKRDRFEHRPNNSYGENIYMSWSSDPNKEVAGGDAVDSWYSEIKDHTFGVEPRTLASGHFTQVMWKGSTEVGTARARSATGKILVVSNYSPAGNVVGHFAENVPPPRK